MSTVTVAKKPPRKLVIAAVIIVALIAFAALFINLWADHLWFSSIGFGTVFNTQLGTQVLLGAIGGLIMGGLPLVAMLVAFVTKPSLPRIATDPIVRIRAQIMPYIKIGLIAPTIVLALLGAVTAASGMPLFLAWMHRKPFGVQDQTFHLDASFFVFTLPWLRSVTSFVSTSLVLALVAGLVALYVVGSMHAGGKVTKRPLAGGIPGTTYRMSAAAAIQLSIQAALVLIVYGLDKLLDRVSYPVQPNKIFTGVGYTEDHSRISAHLVVAIIAFVCAGLFILNVFWRKWINPVAAVVLMVVSSVVISWLVPTSVEYFVVRPSEPDKQAPYMARHIAATRKAFDLEKVDIKEYSAKTTATAGQLRADAEALPGIRLMDPAIVGRTFDQLQQVRGYYTFPPVLDVDRYSIDGKATDVVVAAREIDVNGLPEKGNWNNTHTVYTHGYGVVAAYGNKRQAGGEPEWIAKDIPPTGLLDQKQSRIYFGELQKHFVVVGAKAGQPAIEMDTPVGESRSSYDGPGINIGNFINRMVYAAKFQDLQLLLSDRVHSASKILYDRTPVQRVANVAPWLVTDTDAYPTLVDGRLVWVVDGYTTTSSYPDSQQIDLAGASNDRQSFEAGEAREGRHDVNYMRNAVKGIVDAYTGEVKLYAWDEADPILKTWRSVYSGTVLDRSQIPSELMKHLRYPQDMYKAQREVLGRYHMTDPQAWYMQSDRWVVPEDPIAAKGSDTRTKGSKEAPYYLSIKWPGDAQPVFSLTSVYVPNGRANLASFMAVNADAMSPDYGKFRVLRMSDTQQISGPGQAFNAMIQDPVVAEKLRPFLNQGSAAASYGNLLTIPLGGGLLYVTPVYTQREGSANSTYPTLRFVIVRFGEKVVIADTLQAALDQVFEGDAGATTNEGKQPTTPAAPTTPGTPTPAPGASTTPAPPGVADPAAAKAALAEAKVAFESADKALKAGDLAGYADWMNKAKAAVERAMKAQG